MSNLTTINTFLESKTQKYKRIPYFPYKCPAGKWEMRGFTPSSLKWGINMKELSRAGTCDPIFQFLKIICEIIA
jgi:hypothetical protein